MIGWNEHAVQCSWGVAWLFPFPQILVFWPYQCHVSLSATLAIEFPHALHLSRAKAKHNWNGNMILMRLSKNSSLLLFYLFCTCPHCRKKKRTENSSTLRLSMLVLFCFNEWGFEEFAIPQTSFLLATS